MVLESINQKAVEFTRRAAALARPMHFAHLQTFRSDSVLEGCAHCVVYTVYAVYTCVHSAHHVHTVHTMHCAQCTHSVPSWCKLCAFCEILMFSVASL